MSVHVYTLSDESGVRYVGVSTEPLRRFAEHRKESRTGSTRKARWFRKLLSLNTLPSVRVLCILENREEAFRVEILLISKFRAQGRDLLNLTDGGEGCGVPWTPELRALRRQQMLGFVVTPTHRAALIASVAGKPLSPEHKQKLSDKFKGRPITEEQKRKISDTLTGRSLSEEHKAALRKFRAEHPMVFTTDICQKISNAKSGVPFSDEHKQKLKGRWTDPEVRAKRINGMKLAWATKRRVKA